MRAQHDVLGNYQLAFEGNAKPLFTDNETNSARIHNYPNGQLFVKDAFDEYVVHGRADAVNAQNIGTKFAAHYVLETEPGKSEVVRLRLSETGEAPLDPFAGFDEVFAQSMKEADEFYDAVIPSEMDKESKKVARQGYAGLLWSCRVILRNRRLRPNDTSVEIENGLTFSTGMLFRCRISGNTRASRPGTWPSI